MFYTSIDSQAGPSSCGSVTCMASGYLDLSTTKTTSDLCERTFRSNDLD